MNLRQLRYFVGIVDAGSFSRASRSLHVAQPALSEQISKLEKDLDVDLLTRSQRGVEPTMAGNVVYRTARAVLKEIDHLPMALQTMPGLVGEVSFGLTSSVSDVFTEPIVSAVLGRHPNVRVNVVDGPGHMHHDGLMRGTLDIAMLHEHVQTVGLQRQVLYRQQLFFVERKTRRTAAVGTVRMADLLARKLVLPAMPNPSRAVVEAAFLALGQRPLVVAEATSKAALLSLVAGGVGGTVLAWSNPGRPFFTWSEIVDPVIYHDVSLCTARLLPLSDAASAVQAIAKNVVIGLVSGADWKGATLDQDLVSENTIASS